MCQKYVRPYSHTIRVGGEGEEEHTWRYGSYAYRDANGSPGFKMSAGQTIEIELEWDFTLEQVAKDWGISAFGNKGKVSFKH